MEKSTWNSIISQLPQTHILQTAEWAQVKSKYGWTPAYAVWTADGKFHLSARADSLPVSDHPVAAALVLRRALPLGGLSARLSVLYIPKGPLMDWSDAALRARVLADLQTYAKKHGAIFLKMDPDVVLGTGVPGSEDAVEDNGGKAVMSELSGRGWRYSSDQIQFRNTVLIDLTPSEEDMLARMKQKTRYNVRLGTKKGVTVRVGGPDDFAMLYRMYAETSLRDGFVIRDEGYYRTVWQVFTDAGLAEPLIAEVEGEAVAAVWQFRFAGRAYYIYGMSREAHREKMPNYLLQWEAMRRAKEQGCDVYDLWGAPEVFDENDRMWGVFRFKEGLGGQVQRTLGAWDYAPNPFWYQLYTEILPRVLDVMRRRGRSQTQKIHQGHKESPMI